jgi:hypothetical protein
MLGVFTSSVWLVLEVTVVSPPVRLLATFEAVDGIEVGSSETEWNPVSPRCEEVELLREYGAVALAHESESDLDDVVGVFVTLLTVLSVDVTVGVAVLTEDSPMLIEIVP